MSDFFRRASDALQHRQRQDSTDSTNAPDSSNAAKQPEQPSLSQQVESTQPSSQTTEAPIGQATGTVPPSVGRISGSGTYSDDTGNDAHPKHHRFWVWGHHQDNKPTTKPEPSQAKKDDFDWVIGS